MAVQPFSAGERKAIAAAISRAEERTSGEIVVVVTSASDGYRSFAVMWAAILALAVSLPLIHFTQWPIEHIYLAQLGVFLAGFLLSQGEAFRLAVTPRSVQRARAHHKAAEQFLAQNMHTTEGRTGVLIFVSFAERFAEVIADEAIYSKVSPQVWEATVQDLTAHIGRGEIMEGFLKAIAASGELLAEHFPPGVGDCNELPNHLIVLDAERRA